MAATTAPRGATSASTQAQQAEARAVARRLMPAWRNLPVDGVDYLPGGYSNRNYRLVVAGREYALRVARRPPAPGEDRYLAIAAAPEVVAHDAEHGHLLTRWITGPSFADAPPSPVEAGAFLADLHRQIPAGVRDYDVVAEANRLLRAAPDGGPAMTELLRGLGWRPASRIGCHNDLNPWNVLRGGDGWRTLDWEMAGDNDPLFDLVGLAIGCGWGFAEMCSCHASYQASGGIASGNPQHLRATATVFRIREHAWAAAQTAAGNDRKEIRAQAAAMRRAALGLGGQDRAATSASAGE